VSCVSRLCRVDVTGNCVPVIRCNSYCGNLSAVVYLSPPAPQPPASVGSGLGCWGSGAAAAGRSLPPHLDYSQGVCSSALSSRSSTRHAQSDVVAAAAAAKQRTELNERASRTPGATWSMLPVPDDAEGTAPHSSSPQQLPAATLLPQPPQRPADPQLQAPAPQWMQLLPVPQQCCRAAGAAPATRARRGRTQAASLAAGSLAHRQRRHQASRGQGGHRTQLHAAGSARAAPPLAPPLRAPGSDEGWALACAWARLVVPLVSGWVSVVDLKPPTRCTRAGRARMGRQDARGTCTLATLAAPRRTSGPRD
jgi:hypothetical protein